jgi:hypothetical protein
MSTYCYFQEISTKIFEKFQLHPSVVDIFREGYELKKYSDNYWEGIKKLEEALWEYNDEEPITREIYEQIESDIPNIILAGLVDECWVGSYDAFGWLKNEGLIGIEIGNEDYYSYFTPEQVQIITQKLQQFRRQKFIKLHKILYPQSVDIEETSEEEADFWKHFDEVFSYCQKATQKGYGLLLYYG